MRIAVVSLFPELVAAALRVGVVGRATQGDALECQHYNPRDYAADARKTVDDRPFGGGPGMVMMVAPLLAAVAAARGELPASAPIIYLTPQGEPFNQHVASELAGLPGFGLVAARYEGVDERFVASGVDRELSIGDYVLSGGELAALVVIDAVVRLLPGVLGNPQSAVAESHVDGLLDCPHYTRPEVHTAGRVPPVLLSGDHGAVAAWRQREALRRTWQRQPNLLLDRELSPEERTALAGCMDEDVNEAEAAH